MFHAKARSREKDKTIEFFPSLLRLRPFWFSDSFALFVVLTFDFFARREEFVEEKSPGADAPRLASTVFFVYFVFFVVQFLLVIGLRAKLAPGVSWLKIFFLTKLFGALHAFKNEVRHACRWNLCFLHRIGRYVVKSHPG